MTEWKRVLHQGFVPHLSRKALEALRDALERDDPNLLQGSTTSPPPLMAVRDWPCEGGCLIGYAGWRGEDIPTVGGVEEYFADKCFKADQTLGEPAACRWLLNWFDDTPRDVMRRELLAEIKAALESK